ncbi:MAG TPA: response regulator transcription factor [Thermoanaerobaculia bacterium]|nr:response regulator transcription factor [Thermoanaerobaculia bacterium]
MIDSAEREPDDSFKSVDRSSEKGALRLVIVDHHQLFRDCLASGLAEGQRFEVVAKVSSGEEALEILARTRVDVLLMAMESASEGACGLIREVGEKSPGSKVVLLGRDESEERVLDCFQAGASGYLVRDQSLEDLRSAIEAVSNGKTICSPSVAHSLCERLARLGRERRRRTKLDYLMLTPRELEILGLISEGLSNQEIAERLFLSVHTVKNHVHKTLETLGVHSRWAAVQHAVERGWIKDRRRRS